jgi:hypothetical protein
VWLCLRHKKRTGALLVSPRARGAPAGGDARADNDNKHYNNGNQPGITIF